MKDIKKTKGPGKTESPQPSGRARLFERGQDMELYTDIFESEINPVEVSNPKGSVMDRLKARGAENIHSYIVCNEPGKVHIETRIEEKIELSGQDIEDLKAESVRAEDGRLIIKFTEYYFVKGNSDIQAELEGVYNQNINPLDIIVLNVANGDTMRAILALRTVCGFSLKKARSLTCEFWMNLCDFGYRSTRLYIHFLLGHCVLPQEAGSEPRKVFRLVHEYCQGEGV